MKKTITFLSAALALSACGGGDEEKQDPSLYVGAWSYASGGMKVVCPLGQTFDFDLSGRWTFLIAPGATSPLVRQQPECTPASIPLLLEGGAAGTKNVECMVSVPLGAQTVEGTATFTTWKIVTIDGKTATSEGSGTAKAMGLGCSFLEKATLTKAM